MRRFVITVLAMVFMAARSLWVTGVLLLVLALLGSITGCGGGGDDEPDDPLAHCHDGTRPIPAHCFFSGGTEGQK